MLDGATTTVYIKGSQSRTELLSGLGTEATIHDAKSGTGVILKNYSGQKLMITFNEDDWKKKNKKYTWKSILFPKKIYCFYENKF